MNKKRILAGICAMTLLLTMSSGCGKKENNVEGDVPTLKWYVPGDAEAGLPEVVKATNMLLNDKLGANLDLQIVDYGSYGEKLKLSMSSGDAFDLCYLDADLFSDGTQKGGLLSMEDYFENSKLKEAIPSDFMKFGSYDGEIYAVPNMQILAFTNSVYINKSLADEYGLNRESIKSIEDMEPFLEWVKENKPEYYPIRQHSCELSAMRDFQDVTYDTLVTGIAAYEDSNGQIQVKKLVDVEGFWEFAQLKSDWYKKGYLRSDIATVYGNDWDDVNMGKYAAYVSTYKPGALESANSKKPDRLQYEIEISKPYVRFNAGAATMTGIGRNSKNPEKAFKLIELMNTDKELYNAVTFGVEGSHYEKLDNGKIKLIADGGYAANAGWKFANQYNAYVIDGQPDDVWEKTEEYNNAAKKSKLIGFSADISKIKLELSQIATVNGKYDAVWKGHLPVESYKDDYLAELKSAGIDKVYEEVKKQVDEWVKANDK